MTKGEYLDNFAVEKDYESFEDMVYHLIEWGETEELVDSINELITQVQEDVKSAALNVESVGDIDTINIFQDEK